MVHACSHSAGREEGGLEPHGGSLCNKLEAKLGCMRPTYIDGGAMNGRAREGRKEKE